MSAKESNDTVTFGLQGWLLSLDSQFLHLEIVKPRLIRHHAWGHHPTSVPKSHNYTTQEKRGGPLKGGGGGGGGINNHNHTYCIPLTHFPLVTPRH